MIVRKRHHHHPSPRLRRPEYFRIAKIRQVQIERWVPRVFRPRPPMIVAESQVLRLQCRMSAVLRSVSRVNCYQTWLVIRTEPAGIVFVYNSAAGENHDPVLLANCGRQLFPMHQVAAHGMPPCHMSPLITEWVVLKEQVILALEVHQPVWIIRPVFARREMVLRPVKLTIGSRYRDRLAKRQRWTDRQQ